METNSSVGGRRGVIFTLDLVAALFFFLIILLSVLWLWGQSYRHMGEYREASSRQAKLMDISTMLVKTQGDPPDWELRSVRADSVMALGLASQENVLDPDKLEALSAADYGSLQEILGLGGEDFSLTVSDDFGGTPVVRYSVGNEISSRSRSIVRRYAIFNGSRVELKLIGYYNMSK